MLTFLARFIYRRRWLIVLISLTLTLASAVYSLGLSDSLKAGGFTNPETEASRAAEMLHQQLGRDRGTLIVLFSAKDNRKVSDETFRDTVQGVLARLQGLPEVGTILTSYNTGAAQLISNDQKSTFAVVGLTDQDDDSQVKAFKKLRPLLTSPELEIKLGGRPAVNYELAEQAKADAQKAELLTFPAVGLLLLLLFRSPVAALLPLLVSGVSILNAFALMRLFATFSEASLFTINAITMLGLGLAIDYSLFMVSRFREELVRHRGEVATALTRTMQTAGHTVMFSGVVVVICLLSLLVFPSMFFRTMGLGAALAVLIAMLSAVTLLPAVLVIVGTRVNWLTIRLDLRLPFSPFGQGRKEPGKFWNSVSRLVLRRPAFVLVATLLPLVWVGLPFLRVEFALFDARSLPAHHQSRITNDWLNTKFSPNVTAPVTLVVQTDHLVTEAESLQKLYEYSQQLAAVPGVRRVDSLATFDPRLNKEAFTQAFSSAGLTANPQLAEAVKYYTQGNYTVLSVLYDSPPYSRASQELVKTIRSLSVPVGFSVLIGGETAYMLDFLQSLTKALPLSIGLIVVTMFVILFLMLGSLIVPLKAVILNILSLSVTFGALVWIFQDGNMAGMLGFEVVGSIDGTMPVLLFALAFGLSMDYEVFLLSRIKEHYDQNQDMLTATALGVEKTGGIITGAAITLSVVFVAFALAEVAFVKQLGLGLALAIVVDATLVRLIMVPATLQLMGQYNWWAPRQLKAIYRQLGLGHST